MLDAENQTQCDICQGKHSCYYCGNVKTQNKTTLQELEMIDIYYNGGKIVALTIDDQTNDVDVHPINRDLVDDIGTIVTTRTYEVDPNLHPFWPSAGTYRKILSPTLRKNETIGKMITTVTKVSNTKRLTKLVAFEVIRDE
jgi:ribosomal protein L31